MASIAQTRDVAKQMMVGVGSSPGTPCELRRIDSLSLFLFISSIIAIAFAFKK